ncbi:MAG: biotin--[acetyl-CoA-carboxylase] ligase [Nostocoides sp.]
MDIARVLDHVRADNGPWQDVRWLASVGSTNAAAAKDPRPWTALIAGEQTAGRGRLDRGWVTEAGHGLAISAVLPSVTDPGWLPLLAGWAVREAVKVVTGIETALKWPNDVIAVGAGPDGEDGKLAGILCQAVPETIIVGVGLNITSAEAGAPAPMAVSLTDLGAPDLDQELLVAELLNGLTRVHSSLVCADGREPDLADAYRAGCATIGRQVLIHRPGNVRQAVSVLDVDQYGHLCGLDEFSHEVSFAAGDIVHVRPAPAQPSLHPGKGGYA